MWSFATRLFEEKKMKNLAQTREVTNNFIMNKYEIKLVAIRSWYFFNLEKIKNKLVDFNILHKTRQGWSIDSMKSC